MVVTYSVPELMSIGETILDMHPKEWLEQQRQITESISNQHCQYTNAICVPNHHSLFDNALDEQQSLPINVVLMHLKLNSLKQQQPPYRQRNRYEQQLQQQPAPPPSPHSISMSADTFLKNFAHSPQKLGLANAQQPAANLKNTPSGEDIMSQFCWTDNRKTTKTAQLTDSVADFFRKAQQNFRPSVDSGAPTRVRRLSEVEAELIGQKLSPSSSS